MRNLPRRMHPGIGPAGRNQPDGAAEELSQRFFHALLHGSAIGLPLHAAELGTVILQIDSVPVALGRLN